MDDSCVGGVGGGGGMENVQKTREVDGEGMTKEKKTRACSGKPISNVQQKAPIFDRSNVCTIRSPPLTGKSKSRYRGAKVWHGQKSG